jgi:DNA-binding FrmR family transcriptional regulator
MKTKKQSNILIKRLSRLEGQIGGIKKMIIEERTCNDIITQVMAAREAMSSLGIEIIKNDIACQPKNKKIDERYLKSLFKIN